MYFIFCCICERGEETARGTHLKLCIMKLCTSNANGDYYAVLLKDFLLRSESNLI